MYLVQHYNSVYDYWECDKICKSAAEAMAYMMEWAEFGKVRYKRIK